VTEIAAEFKTTNSAVSWGITITLMLRSVGALVFGGLSDRYGRKWTMITNLFLFIIFELASGFAQSLPQFLGVRALYGIAMGGLYGPAAATALEDLPYDARGLLSGLYQQGYAIGYLLAAIFYRAVSLPRGNVVSVDLTGDSLCPQRPMGGGHYFGSALALPS
jgi:SHS family lactate transporter-like MFS transporter